MLVCTTIIESGLDIPSANTIIVNRADRFGLAQIYQLRGRVGRSDEQAYAYLIIPHESVLTKDAQKRLKVLMEHSDLGSGFQIAMNDLKIRGGGTILVIVEQIVRLRNRNIVVHCQVTRARFPRAMWCLVLIHQHERLDLDR